MDSIISGVYRVSGGYVNSYLIDGDEGVTLIDTLLPKQHGKIVAALDEIGRSADDITAIILTHSHVDHAGGTAALKEASGAPLYASAADAAAIRGEERPPPPPFLERVPLVSSMFRALPGADPAIVEHVIGESAGTRMPEDLRVIDTPGHTPGHVSLLVDREGGLLIAGDAAYQSKGEIKRGWFNRSTPQIDGSLRRMAEFDFERACFGHSGPLRDGASGAFRRFVATLDQGSTCSSGHVGCGANRVALATPGGWLLANPDRGDAAMASIDPGSDRYLISQRLLEAAPELLRQAGRSVADTRSSCDYLLRRTPTRLTR